VSETAATPDIDVFLLARFTPKINEKWQLYTQLETFNALPTDEKVNRNFVQRFRLGLKHKATSFGIGSDFTQSGRATYFKTKNIGGFVRYEF
jgi:hypothetical protein